MDNPEEIEKIEAEEQIEAKIVDLLPEDAENNEKLKQMDALVASYIAECNAEIEKNAKNTEKNAENCGIMQKNAEESGNLRNNAENNGKMRKFAKPMNEIAENCSQVFRAGISPVNKFA